MNSDRHIPINYGFRLHQLHLYWLRAPIGFLLFLVFFPFVRTQKTLSSIDGWRYIAVERPFFQVIGRRYSTTGRIDFRLSNPWRNAGKRVAP